MSQEPLRVIETSLPTAECLRRLLDAVDDAPASLLDSSRPHRTREFAGSISEDAVCIFRRGSSLGSFRAVLVGSLHAATGRTQLRYRIGLARRASVFMAAWFGLVAAMLVFLVLALWLQPGATALERGRLLEGIAVICAFGGIGAGILLLSRLRQPREDELLRHAVCRLIDGVERQHAA